MAVLIGFTLVAGCKAEDDGGGNNNNNNNNNNNVAGANTVVGHCTAIFNLFCELAFGTCSADPDFGAFAAAYTDLNDCKAQNATECGAGGNPEGISVSSTASGQCLTAVRSTTATQCAALAMANPASCDAVTFPTPYTGGPDTPQHACWLQVDEICDRAFAVPCPTLITNYPSVADCVLDFRPSCPDSTSTDVVNGANAATCVANIASAQCTDLQNGVAGCDNVWTPAPISPAGCVTITAGTTQGEVTNTDPLYNDGAGYGDKYCVALTTGQSLSLLTSAGATGTPIADSVVYLYDPAGNFIAFNDDIDLAGGNYFSELTGQVAATSGDFIVVVRGFDDTTFGTYGLTVTIN
jgi:hypothetical protein